MKRQAVISILLLICAFAPKVDLFIAPAYFPKPVYDFAKNPLSAEKILLGRTLFYDPILSKNGTISCESCHSPYSAFTHIDHNLSHGIFDSIGTRNSPALMNLAWQSSFMWDGAINNLDMQALAPISHRLEMGSSLSDVVARLNGSAKYRKLFARSFGDSLATGERTLKALSQFMLTLVSANAKYDSVMRKESAFSRQEAQGYEVYKQNCASCHAEPLFTSNSFQNNGLTVDAKLNDLGRMKITGRAADSLKFKVPTLRNIEYSHPYMHDGRFRRLADVLEHYGRGIQPSKTLARELQHGIRLSGIEKADLTAFLLTLSDKAFVFNPAFGFPR